MSCPEYSGTNLPITLQAFFRHNNILRLSFCDINIIGAYVAGAVSYTHLTLPTIYSV